MSKYMNSKEPNPKRDVGKDLEDIGEAIFKIGTALEGKTKEEARQILLDAAKELGIEL